MSTAPSTPSVWRRSGVDPAGRAVQDSMYRALAVLRVVVLLNALALGWVRRDNVDHPVGAVVVYVGIALWTAVAVWAYAAPLRRRVSLLVLDLAVAVTAIIVSAPIKGPEMRATLPGYWVMGVVLAWAVRWRWPGGLVAALAVTAADLAVRVNLDQGSYGNIFLLLIGGPVVGFLSGLLQDLARDRDLAERRAAVAAERARLARVVHDGVLQVLALVQRRGTELGGDAAELGRLAGEQEVALRALVQAGAQEQDDDAVHEDATIDLAMAVNALQARTSPRVNVAVPGRPVLLPARTAEELVAVVRACLHNVAEHVAVDAPAWVLLEDLGDRVVLTVRDDGPGIAPGRLEEATAEGRLGVRESIRGRLAELGGTATLTTAPGRGTEWELEVPRTDHDLPGHGTTQEAR